MWKIRAGLQRPRLALLALTLAALVAVVPLTASHARQSDESAACTLQTIAGTYSFRTTGVQIRSDGTQVEFASLGVYVRDGQGNLTSGSLTANTGGTVTRSTFNGGSYTVNPDCTGSQTTILQDGRAVNLDFVIADSGRIVEFVLVGPTSVVGGTQTKQ